MNELLEQLKKMVTRISDLETAFYRIKNLVFPTGSGRLSVPKYAGDPASPANGDCWYNSSTHKLRVRANGVNTDLH